MAQQPEPMDIDSSFDNKENSLHHSNVLPFTEKGYEELDVSDLNMKLRYSVTPASSPMSKSCTAACPGNQNFESGDVTLNVNENINLTRSLNSTITVNDNALKPSKALPLQSISPEQLVDSSRPNNVLRPLETADPTNNGNITITLNEPCDIDENLSLPSSSSSAIHTPEATTPTKDLKDGGSPIMRGLKTVLNMFRSSQSPIPPADGENKIKPELLSPDEQQVSLIDNKETAVLASTPISSHRKKEMSPTKRSSPQKDSTVVFNDDLEKELQWKDETTIIFSQERIPIHKLLLPQHKENILNKETANLPNEEKQDINTTVEYMDISYNDSFKDKTITNVTETESVDQIVHENSVVGESDSEFVDCETTFTKNESISETCDMNTVVNSCEDSSKDVHKNESGSRLKQIILDTTQDILDATLSVRPEDLLPENTENANDMSALVFNTTIDSLKQIADSYTIDEVTLALEANEQIINETIPSDNTINLNPIESLDVIKTIEVIPPTEPLNETFDTEALNKTDEKLDCNTTLTIENVLEDNKNLDNNSTMENFNITQTMTELPTDIPLPDEDDLDKELDTPLDITVTNNTEPIVPSLDSKILSNSYEEIHTINVTEKDNLNNTVKETSPIIDLPYVNNVVEFTNNTELAYNSIEMSDNPKDNINQLVKDIVEITETENNCLTHIDIENLQINKEDKYEESNILLLNTNEQQDVIAMDINQSTGEIQPLPDIINETVTMSNKEAIEGLDSLIVKEEIESKSVDINRDENQMLKNEIKAIIVDSPSDFEKLPVTVTDNTMVQEISNMCTDVKSETVGETSPSVVIECSAELLDVSNQAEISNDYKDEEEQILVSGNNSPFVSVISENIMEDFKNSDNNIVEDSTPTNEVVRIPPQSPPIASKGYNFNFDDMSFDPFATKTRIRLSPPLSSPAKTVEDTEVPKTVDKPIAKKDFNRRKSQPDRKKPTASKKKLNSTFSGKINEKVREKSLENHDNTMQSTSTTIVNVTENYAPTEICDEPHKNPESNIELPTATSDFFLEKTLEEKISEKCLDNNIPLDTPTPGNLCVNNVEVEEIKNNRESPVPVPVSKDISTTDSSTLLQGQIDQSISSNIANLQNTGLSIESNQLSLKETSSSEQSTYLSACGSSSEINIPIKNVFNLPEIDDINFNPFASKSKMRQSPPPCLDMENPFMTKTKLGISPNSSYDFSQMDDFKMIEDKIETEYMEKDASRNLSNSTNSSKATDEKNITTKEVNTEDEDTVEGPFIETDDVEPCEKIAGKNDENKKICFSELATKSNEENLDGELFIDAEAFEFLLNQNKCNTVVDSGKESLFLKFDPLFAKRMSAITSDGVVAALSKIQKKQSTPIKDTKTSPNLASPTAGPSNLNVTQDIEMNTSDDFNDDLNITVSKPMMVVPPAVNSVTPRNKSITPTRSNRSSITFTSPAMAVIDRLLSLSGNNSLVHETTITQVNRDQSETEIALSQLRELLAEKEISVYKLRSESNELKDRLSSLEGHVKNLETEAESRLHKINQLNSTLVEKIQVNKNMAVVVEEYERTIARLIADIAQDKKNHDEERIKLINERDEQTAHLASMEVSFSDLHSKYEKSKQVILSCKANENVYKESIKQFEESLAKMQNSYEHLKQHAASKLNNANLELEKMNRSHEAEVLKLNAMIKRKELHITSLEESLVQKTKANEELTAICDELINKVG